jgi:hypothetical protein
MIMNEKMQLDMYTIVKFAILGLEKMKDNIYSDDITLKIVLQYLITMMSLAINNKWDEDQIVKSTYTNVLSEKIKHNIDSIIVDSVCKNLVDADNLALASFTTMEQQSKDMTNNKNTMNNEIRERDIILNKYIEVDQNVKNIKNNVNILITCVHDMLKLRDSEFINLMKQITTTL